MKIQPAPRPPSAGMELPKASSHVIAPSILADAPPPPEPLPALLQDAIRAALRLSFLVYTPLPHAESELRAAGYENIRVMSRWYSGAQLACCTKDGQAFIAFRGSESFLDWVVDFFCVPFFWPLRHAGFEYAWRTVRREVRQWLAGTAPGRPLMLCGHSLGGGVAHLAAFALAADQPVANVITFGAPKACLLPAARRYNETVSAHEGAPKLGDITYCVVNQRDIVAKVPPAFLGFRDVGRLVYIDRDCNVRLGEDAARVRDRESGADLDYLLDFFEDERAAAVGSAAPAGWDAFYARLRQGARTLANIAPVLKAPMIPPLMYLIVSFYFMRSGLSHLTGKYTAVFFATPAALGFRDFTPSRLKRIVSTTIRMTLGFGFLTLFLLGLIYICAWSFGSLLEKS